VVKQEPGKPGVLWSKNLGWKQPGEIPLTEVDDFFFKTRKEANQIKKLLEG
jgi:hypothetical protein